MIIGVMPITISTTFDNSSSPNTMNRMGSTASGGIMDSTVMNGDNVAPTSGMLPVSDPRRQRNSRAHHEPNTQPPEARHGVVPQQVFAGALVFGERELFDGVAHLRRAGQQLVVGIDR
jgi:hypothetical protein